MMRTIAAIVTVLSFASSASEAATIISLEAPGAQSTTISFGQIAVETFDALAPGVQTPVNTSFAAIGVTAVFSSTSILGADQFGGAGGVGNQVAVRNTGDLDISFTGTPLNYFGLWASAFDAANTVSFSKGRRC